MKKESIDDIGVDFDLLVDPDADLTDWQSEMMKTHTLRHAILDVEVLRRAAVAAGIPASSGDGDRRAGFIFLARSPRVAEEICRGTITIGALAAAREQQRAICGILLSMLPRR